MPRKNRPILAPKPNLQATSCLSKRRYASKKQAQTAADKRMLLSQDLELNIYAPIYFTDPITLGYRKAPTFDASCSVS